MSEHICGFCMTKHHQNCKKQITYYDKTWVCTCKVCEEIEKEKEKENGTQENNNS